MATAALRDGNDAPDPLALKLPTERLVDDRSNEAAAFVACDGTLYDSLYTNNADKYSKDFNQRILQGIEKV